MPHLQITYVNVGQGDCTLIKCPDGKTVMVDCGTTQGANADTLQRKKLKRDEWYATYLELKYMKPSQWPIKYKEKLKEAEKKWKDYSKLYEAEKKENAEDTLTEIETRLAPVLPDTKKIDILVLTHHDDDHYNKVTRLINLGVSFGKIYYSGPIVRYRALRRNYAVGVNVDEYVSITVNGVAAGSQTAVESATDVTRTCSTTKHTIVNDTANNFAIDILASNVHTHPDDRKRVVTNFHFGAGDINGRSIVLLVKYGNDKIMLAGDATTETEKFLVQQYVTSQTDKTQLRAGTLRIGHHGSPSSSHDAFISAVAPTQALISCAKYNVHGLPRKEITDRYLQYFGTNVPGKDEAHDILYYTDKTDYDVIQTTEPLWQTWCMGNCVTTYDGT